MFPNAWPMTKKVFSNWNRHEAPRMGAALAFYTILSLSPLLLLAVAIAGFFVNKVTALQQLTAQIQGLVGENGARPSGYGG